MWKHCSNIILILIKTILFPCCFVSWTHQMHILSFPNTSKCVYLSLKLCVKQFLSLHNTLRFKSSLQLWTLFNLFSRAHVLSLTDCVLLTGRTLAWRCGLGQKQCSYKLAKQTANKGLLPQCSRWWPSRRRTDVAAGHPCPIMTLHQTSFISLFNIWWRLIRLIVW